MDNENGELGMNVTSLDPPRITTPGLLIHVIALVLLIYKIIKLQFFNNLILILPLENKDKINWQKNAKE